MCNKLPEIIADWQYVVPDIMNLPWKIALRFWTCWTSCTFHIQPIEELCNLAIFYTWKGFLYFWSKGFSCDATIHVLVLIGLLAFERHYHESFYPKKVQFTEKRFWLIGHLRNTFSFLLQNDKDVVMRLLLHVKGVISITFDLNQKRCILRTKQDVKPEVTK